MSTKIVPVPKPTNHRFKDIEGQTFAELTVVAYAGSTKGRAKWYCVCSCGNIAIIGAGLLRSGHTKSCGCVKAKRFKELITTQGGLSDSPEYKIWASMKARCYLPSDTNYYNYGAKGVTMDESWRCDFVAFLTHVGRRPSPDHSIDRINNTKGYFPGNVRWATRYQQNRNTRRNRMFTYQGRTLCLKDWAILFNMPRKTLSDRIDKHGFTFEEALLKPVKPNGPKRLYVIDDKKNSFKING